MTIYIPDKPESISEDFYQAVRNLINLANGNISLGTGQNQTNSGNIKGKFIEVKTPVSANTDFTVYHDLGYIPNNYLIVKCDLPIVIYSSPAIGADARTLTLRHSVVGWSGSVRATITVWVF